MWESSIDGPIGTGTTFTRDDLSLGTHTITLRVTDSNGATGTATAQLTILQQSTTGTITGTVTYGGQGVAGVLVTLTGTGSRTAVTGTGGWYYFGQVAAGTNTVSISGFPQGMTFPATSQTVTVGPSETVRVDFTGP